MWQDNDRVQTEDSFAVQNTFTCTASINRLFTDFSWWLWPGLVVELFGT